MVNQLLSAFAVAAVVSVIVSVIALTLFPWFRSGERKPGDFKPNQSTGSGVFHIEVRRGRANRPRVRPRSNELPLVGGGAMLLAIIAGSVAAGYVLRFSQSQWTLLFILLLSAVGYATVGLIDDMRKVYRGVGISEMQKAAGVVLVSLLAAVLLNRRIIESDVTARLAYPPYNQAPFIGPLLVGQHFAWVVFFILLTVIIASATALAVDFSDGMDGLTGGLILSAALSYAVVIIDEGGKDRWPLIVAALALAGAAAGYLPFNWPSAWNGGRNPRGRRRAKLIMGDTGSLAVGGTLALIAIVARQELMLVVIGGAFVLEGLSALISARILVKFYRHFLFVERYGGSRGFPHTELPLPFLATPMHHHYDLLNINRRRIVYGAWLLGAGLGILGIASAVGPFSWERYLARFAALVVLIAVWQAGPWTKTFFIGLERSHPDNPEAPRRLLLCHGAPFRLFGIPLYRRIDSTRITNSALVDPMERLLVWQRLSVFDARSLLGYFCYREGAYEDAYRIWDRLPDGNIQIRPDIQKLIAEVTHAVAVQTSTEKRPAQQAALGTDGAVNGSHAGAVDLGTTSRGMPKPPTLSSYEPSGDKSGASHPDASTDEARLWRASVWAAASGMGPTAQPGPEQPVIGASTQPISGKNEPGDEADSLAPSASLPSTLRPPESSAQ